MVFLKAPRLGEVKTRLAASLGEALAVEIYRAMAEAVMRATRPRDPSDFRRVLCHTPADGGPEVAAWFKGETIEPQSGSDLGDRMHQAFIRSSARGATSTVLIGTDCPSLSREKVIEAFAALRTTDVVVRGAEDGGYTLIGMNRPHAALFTGIEWSRDTVLLRTAARAAQAGLRLRVLGTDTDVDTVGDLRRQFECLRPHLAPDLVQQVETRL